MSAVVSAEAMSTRTIHSKVSKSRACSPLHFGIMAAEEEEDWVECVAANRPNFFLGDFGKCERGATLKIDIVRKRECGQRGEGRIPEEVGRRPVCSTRWSTTTSVRLAHADGGCSVAR